MKNILDTLNWKANPYYLPGEIYIVSKMVDAKTEKLEKGMIQARAHKSYIEENFKDNDTPGWAHFELQRLDDECDILAGELTELARELKGMLTALERYLDQR